MSQQPGVVDIRRIMDLLPHRYPFLLVDRVVALDFEQNSITAYKNVTMNEPFFQGHFPGLPVMPGVLLVEALAQAGGIFVLSTPGFDAAGKAFLFTSMDKVRLRKPVVPGDQLFLHVTDFRNKLGLWKLHGVAKVNGEVAAEGDLSAAIVNKESL